MKTISAQAAKSAFQLEGVSKRDALWLVMMSLMLFTLLLPFSSYVAALPLIQDEWGLNNTQAGAIYSAYLAGFALSALLVIPLTDRLPTWHILVVSSTIAVAASALFPIAANGIVSASILRALAGLGLVGVYTPGMRVIAERFPNAGRGLAIGTFVTFFYAANSASLAATGGLMSFLEWRDAYFVMALAAAASVPMAYLLLRGQRNTAARGSSGRLNLAVLKNRRARIFTLGYTLHAAELYVVRVWLPAFLTFALVSRGIDSAQAAVTAATVGGIALSASAVGPVMGGILSDKFGRARSAIAIFALSGAASWAIGWMGGFPWGVIIALTVVYGWAIAADSAIYSTAVTEAADPAHLGSTMAMHSFLGFTGGVIGPILVGAILDVSPESLKWGLGFSFVGLLALVAIVALAHLRPETRRR